ncbi:pentatricopeptide repeat-containing protein At4g14850 [Punica granatum]|uniref:Pentatricopeptide repeat-containing protein At4g14850 n=2 Tax=Punica granatum TaxID=22663 RepID=A0A6P8CGA3_PUNGR|nr:pentatricopeptide repeat-containing protein At4g14850 [Punica granatum]XP_031381475.1 pentatricopeptide repeat-containing protein At4g14850 [Punica granatum]OWM80285.1 hypothetical protein CDL15_Pgr019565 [Punica granatum]PKI38608.1 hypothetical protein CRG98_041041 [Punica granatum]
MPAVNLGSLAALVQSALSIRSPRLGRAAHAHITKALQTATQLPLFLSDHLVHMYSKLDRLDSALLLLRLSTARSVVSWSSLISGSVHNGHFTFALLQFTDMLRDGVLPNDFTFPCVFKASASLRMPFAGKQIHGLALRVGLLEDVFVGCSAFDMYCRTDLLDDAMRLFEEMPERNVVTWNSYISAALLHGRASDAMKAFIEFRRAGGVPDPITFCVLLNACEEEFRLELGRALHGFIIIGGFEADLQVMNGLIDFYGKCGKVECTEMVFDSTAWQRNDVTWCSLIAAYVQNYEEEKACGAFLGARREEVQLTDFMLSSVLNACARLAALELGRLIQALAVKVGIFGNIFVAGALVNMYGKCGHVHEAKKVFAKMPERNLVTWNSMISGYAHLGLAEQAVLLFEEMVSSRVGIVPNCVTFVCLLSACSRAGEVKLGMEIFEAMRSRFQVEPVPEHYACIVDLLGRAGMVEETLEFIGKIPFHPTISIWGSFLGACRVHRKPELGMLAANKLLELDPRDSGNRVVLSNMFAAAGRWEEASRVRMDMDDVIRVKKGTGYSWITVKDKVHVFRAKDTSHERNSEIQETLAKLRKDMERAGYLADPNYALYDLEEEEKITEVWNHSEKIALAFGLLSIPPGVPVRIMKNLRICGDCHSAFKFISCITGKEIIVRDNSRFHHFRDGLCSCKDFW